MFDPYHKWLGIPPGESPPTYYQLLAIADDETDSDVINAASLRQSAYVRTFQRGQHSEDATRVLNELAAATVCLLDSRKRAKYDAELHKRLQRKPLDSPAPQVPGSVPDRLPKRMSVAPPNSVADNQYTESLPAHLGTVPGYGDPLDIYSGISTAYSPQLTGFPSWPTRRKSAWPGSVPAVLVTIAGGVLGLLVVAIILVRSRLSGLSPTTNAKGTIDAVPQDVPISIPAQVPAAQPGLGSLPVNQAGRLRWKFLPGQRIKVLSKSTGEAEGNNMVLQQESTRDFEWSVVRVDESGAAQVIQRVARVRDKVVSKQGPQTYVTIDFDSDDRSIPPKDHQRKEYARLAQETRKRIRMIVTSTGQITDVHRFTPRSTDSDQGSSKPQSNKESADDREAEIERGLEERVWQGMLIGAITYFCGFPDDTLSPGSTWQSQQGRQKEDEEFEKLFTVAGPTVKGTQRIDFRSKISTAHPFYPTRTASTGHLLFDVQRGATQECATDLNWTMQAKTFTSQSRSHTELRLVAIELADPDETALQDFEEVENAPP